MKKSLSIVFGLLTLLAGAAETSVESKNTLGIKRTECTAGKEIAVGVPWLKAADKDGMTVAELITTGLTADDQIQVYSLEDNAYFSWHYNGTGWIADTITDGLVVPEAMKHTLSRGTAFWYKPADTKESGFFTQVGTYSDAAITTKVNKVHADEETVGTFANPVHNLLVNPKYEDFDITALKDGCAKNDVIVLAASGERYRYDGSEWGQDIDQEVTKFGVTVTQKVFVKIGETGVGNGSVSAGTAFWYLSAGGAPEIEW